MNTHPLHPETNPVMALADGEQASLPVGGDAVAAMLAHQAQLRRATKTAMDEFGACPADLRAMFAAPLAPAAQTANLRLAAAPAPSLRFAPKKWHRYAVAASLLLALGLGIAVGRGGGPVPGLQTAMADDQLADRLIDRNVLCADHQELLRNTGLFVNDVREMPAFMLKKFGQLPAFGLNFAAVGYDYKLAGTCSVPGPDSIHAFYENGKGQALSLWVRRADGHLKTEPGRVRISLPPKSPKAVAAWRDAAGLEYYLVAPSIEELERVLRLAQDSPLDAPPSGPSAK